MMYIFPFFFFLGPCIPANHFVFTWIVQTLIIVYMGSVYGYVFMATGMGIDCMDVFGYVFMAMAMCLWLCVWILGLDPPRGLVHQYRGLPLLRARFHHYRDLLFHEARFHNPWVLLLHEAHFSKFWDSLLREAHFHNPWVLLLREVHLDDSLDFSNFS
jgi:hypothetical protein